MDSLDGPISVRIPEGVSHGEVLRVSGKGVVKDTGGRGDLYVVIEIAIPKSLSKSTRKMIEELKREGI
jgi:DnaJ-class molecular chaperone